MTTGSGGAMAAVAVALSGADYIYHSKRFRFNLESLIPMFFSPFHSFVVFLIWVFALHLFIGLYIVILSLR